MNDEAKAEAGRLQHICIEEIAANDPSYLKGVYNSIAKRPYQLNALQHIFAVYARWSNTGYPVS
jgi:hypothetical protein